MKKVLAILCTIVMLTVSLSALSEVLVAFDKSAVTGSDLYSYDKFSKEWNVGGSYIKEYRDATVAVSLLLWDTYVDEGWGPELRITYFDKENKCYDRVTAFRAIVGETMYSFEDLKKGSNNNSGFAFGGNVMKELMNALISGKEVAFQLDHTDTFGSGWTSTIDPVSYTDLSELIEMAKLMEKSHAWDIDVTPMLSDESVQATME